MRRPKAAKGAGTKQDELPWEYRKREPDLEYELMLSLATYQAKNNAAVRFAKVVRHSKYYLLPVHGACPIAPAWKTHAWQDRKAAALAAPQVEFSRAVHQKRQKEKDDQMVKGQHFFQLTFV